MTPLSPRVLATTAEFEHFYATYHRGRLLYEAGEQRAAMELQGIALAICDDLAASDRSLVRAAMDALVERLRGLDYAREYLRSSHWRTVREVALWQASQACRVCSRQRSLHVHHRTYENLGAEHLADVTVLCAGCHRLFHEHGTLER